MSQSPATPALLPPTQTSVNHIVTLLAAGRLVALPTETVYGIALSLLDSAARDRVKALKGLQGANPEWVLHLGAPEQATQLLPDLPPLPRRLIQRAWPGPVAFQIRPSAASSEALVQWLGDAAPETLIGGRLTLRCPDAPVTQDILASCFARRLPIAIIGATTPEARLADEPSSIPQSLADHIDAVLDGGPTRYRKPSTLVRIDDDRLQVLRPGVIDERIIHRLADMVILFICSGNTCRSPMAAAIATRIMAERLGVPPEQLPAKHIVIQSAGLHATRGMRAAAEAIDAAQAHGGDLSGHLSQPATMDLLRRADVIYTMTQAHRDDIVDTVPGLEKKTHRLDPQQDIDDPIGCGEDVYNQVADHLETVLRQRLSEIAL